MSEDLEELIEMSRRANFSPTEKEEQRRSFAYGNANIENERVTKETIETAAEDLKAESVEK